MNGANNLSAALRSGGDGANNLATRDARVDGNGANNLTVSDSRADGIREGYGPADRAIGDQNGNPATSVAVTIVVPTRNEADNVEPLLDRLAAVLADVNAEVVFVDDSDDETPDVVRSRGRAAVPGLAVRLLHREPGDRAGGLGTAVAAGFAAARGEWIVVMDGDLQHPPEVAAQLVATGRRKGVDLVVASRHVEGGDSGGLAGASRVMVSSSATTLAKVMFPRRLRGITDPMSGFFAIRRTALDLDALRPDGFKILLEVLVRTPGITRAEVGFVFQDRLAGESKASLAEGMRFARHLVRLSASRLTTGTTGRMVGFGLVGVSGILVNTGAMWLLADPAAMGLNYLLAAVIATQVSTTWNFLLIDRIVYRGAKHRGPVVRYGIFSVANNAVLVLRLPVLALLVDVLGINYLIANLITLLISFLARFAMSDRLIYPRPGADTVDLRVTGTDAERERPHQP